MSAATLNKTVQTLGGAALAAVLLTSYPAYAQEAQRPLTIADCPPGYVLGVQDTSEPQPVTKLPVNPYAGTNAPTASSDAAKEAAEAPKMFMTGCIPPTPQQAK